MNLKENKMSYDPRAVKVSKSVKRVAATMTDANKRRDFIKGYARAEEMLARTRSTRTKGDSKD
jgi:hypothetical protein